MSFKKVFIEEVREMFPKNRALLVALEGGDMKSAEALLKLMATPAVKQLRSQALLIIEACDRSLAAFEIRKRLRTERIFDLEEIKNSFPQSPALLAAAEDQDMMGVNALLLVEEELSPRAIKDLSERLDEEASRATLAKDLLEKLRGAWWAPTRGSIPLSEMRESGHVEPGTVFNPQVFPSQDPTLPPQDLDNLQEKG